MGILGAVLAGGQSRRFGSDKARAVHAGRTLIDHAISALEQQSDEVIVCGRTVPGARCVPDRPRPSLGPLGGLNAALAYARRCGFEAVLTIGCDTPHIPPDLARRLAERALPAVVDQLPVIGLWPAGLSLTLDRFLAGSDDRSLRRWATSVGATRLMLPDALPNINTPADLDALATMRTYV